MTDDTVRVCPTCDDPDIETRTGGQLCGDYDWRCQACGARFETPDTRSPDRAVDSGHTKLKKVGFEGLINE